MCRRGHRGCKQDSLFHVKSDLLTSVYCLWLDSRTGRGNRQVNTGEKSTSSEQQGFIFAFWRGKVFKRWEEVRGGGRQELGKMFEQ